MDVRKKITRLELESMTKEELFEEYLEVHKQMKQLAIQVEELKEKNNRGAARKAKLTEEQKQKIYLRRAEDKSIRAIAEELGCSVGLVHKTIKERNTDWRNDDIKTLAWKVKHRQQHYEEFNFPPDGAFKQELDEMKARLKELQEAEKNKDK